MMQRSASITTPLTSDDDVLAAAKALSELESETLGRVISVLARSGVPPPDKRAYTRNGMPLLTIAFPRLEEVYLRMLSNGYWRKR